jgi:hypothetical protein
MSPVGLLYPSMGLVDDTTSSSAWTRAPMLTPTTVLMPR